jgi:hypothetical protein
MPGRAPRRTARREIEALARGIRDHDVAAGHCVDGGAGFSRDHERSRSLGFGARGEPEREALETCW